jgi:hypothetical protein
MPFAAISPFAAILRGRVPGGGLGWTQPDELRWMFPSCEPSKGASTSPASTLRSWIAWMNGALESAERVIAEILRADGEPRRAVGLVESSR